MVNDETNDILRGILKWQELQGKSILRELIPSLLDGDKKKAVYELTNGKNSAAFVSKKASIATGTVSNWWNNWFAFGILTKEGTRYKHIISLKDLGL